MLVTDCIAQQFAELLHLIKPLLDHSDYKTRQKQSRT